MAASMKGNQNAKGHGYGRPKVYTDEMIEEEAEALIEWMELPESIFLKSFAIERGYHPNRLKEFASTNSVFSGILEISKAWQEQKLVTQALFNKTNSGMTKFVLANHHGYVEKTQVSGDTANPLEFLLRNVDGKTAELVNDQD